MRAATVEALTPLALASSANCFFHASKDQEWWRSLGAGQYVYGKGRVQYKSKQCYNLALEAIAHEMANPKREWSAKQKWREIFGSAFRN